MILTYIRYRVYKIEQPGLKLVITELVRRLRCMCVTQRRDYFMSILMYKSIHGMTPAYLCNEITLHSEIAERTTRSVNDNNVFVPYAHLESFKNYFTHIHGSHWSAVAQW